MKSKRDDLVTFPMMCLMDEKKSTLLLLHISPLILYTFVLVLSSTSLLHIAKCLFSLILFFFVIHLLLPSTVYASGTAVANT